MTDTENQALFDRMAAFALWWHKAACFDSEHKPDTSTFAGNTWKQEASAIVSLLPKSIDPKLLRAREICAEVYERHTTTQEWAADLRAGKNDEGPIMQAVRRALDE